MNGDMIDEVASRKLRERAKMNAQCENGGEGVGLARVKVGESVWPRVPRSHRCPEKIPWTV